MQLYTLNNACKGPPSHHMPLTNHITLQATYTSLPITLRCKLLTRKLPITCKGPPFTITFTYYTKILRMKLTRITVVVHVVCIVEIFCGINFHQCGIDHHMQSLTQDKKIS